MGPKAYFAMASYGPRRPGELTYAVANPRYTPVVVGSRIPYTSALSPVSRMSSNERSMNNERVHWYTTRLLLT